MAMAGTSMAKATMVSGMVERSVSRTPVSSSPSSFLGRSVCVPRAALPVRRFRTQSIRAETRDPVEAAKQGADQTASDAQKLAKEGGAEAKNRTTDAAKDFGSSVQNTTNEMQRAAGDTANRLKEDAKDVTEPADDLLAKTRQEGREAFAEMGDKNKDAKDRNLGVEIQGSAGNALADGLENVQTTAKKAGSAISESAQKTGKEFVDNVSQGLSEAGDRLKGATQDAVKDTKDFVDADGAKQRLKEGQELVGKNVDSAKKHADEALNK